MLSLLQQKWIENFVPLDLSLTSNWSFDFPLTQKVLADAVGLSIVHLNRTLMDMRRSGLVIWERHTVTIKDWERLAALADLSQPPQGTALGCQAVPVNFSSAGSGTILIFAHSV